MRFPLQAMFNRLTTSQNIDRQEESAQRRSQKIQKHFLLLASVLQRGQAAKRFV